VANKVDEKPRGILNPKLGEQKFQLARYEPSEPLAFFVEHYWTVKWDLRGQTPYNSETLPHPSIHLTVEPETAHLVGIVTRKFSRLLQEQGWVFGIKFNPGAFYPFVQRPIATFTDKTIPLADVFGTKGIGYAEAMRAATNDEARVAIAEEFLNSFAPPHDENVALVKGVVETIATERAITKVDHLVSRFKLNKRGLQRLFNEYVGVSPKWVIQRYRLHEAADQVAAGEVVDWAKLAVDLGYFDQAHFIKDFKAMVGVTPAEYAKTLGRDAAQAREG
jgi:AraC-like DNA-binding protein